MLVDSPMTRIPLLSDTLITLLLFLLSAALGRRLLRLIHAEITDPLERGLFALTLGLGMVSFVPFTLFAVGIGKPAVIAGVTLLLFLLLLPDVRGILQQVWRAVRPNLASLPIWAGVLLLALLPLLLFTFCSALCPPTDPDGLHYHLTAPLRYLHEGRFVYMPTFLHVHWPLGIEMLFGVGQAFNLHYAAGMVQYGIGILLMLAAYALGRRIASPTIGWLAAALTFYLIRAEMSWAYNDLGIGLYTLMAGYAYYLGWLALTKRDTECDLMLAPKRRSVVWHRWGLAAVCAGLAATAKLPGLLTILLVAVMAFLALWQSAEEKKGFVRFRSALFPAVGMLAVGVLVVTPWLLRSWALTGAPVYPYFGGLFGAKDWSPEWMTRLNEYFQMFNTLRTRQLTPEMVVRVRAVTVLALVLFGGTLALWRGTRQIQPLIVFCFALVTLQVATSGIYVRYFMPMMPLGAVLLLYAVRNLISGSDRERWIAVGALSLLPWGLHRIPQQIPKELSQAKTGLSVALGVVPRDTYLTEQLPIYPTVLWCNANLSPNATVVLGVIDSYAALFRNRTLATNYYTQDALRYDNDTVLFSDLARLGATHILVQENSSAPEMQAKRDKEARVRDAREFGTLARVCAKYGKLLTKSNGYALYAWTHRGSGEIVLTRSPGSDKSASE